YMVQIIYACGFDLRLNVSMLAIKCIYACYQTHLCLLSNASMLAVKTINECRDVAVASLKTKNKPFLFYYVLSHLFVVPLHETY
ncbi:hypothetical protein, partial [Prevotella sp.]|uniref:hypothetical protein n=1 Tax=Prevotella sp. TaxID=59823 RepID=UPI003AF8AC02